MSSPKAMEEAIQQVMAAVRNARKHPETAEEVDEALHALTERAREWSAGEILSEPLSQAQSAFRAGEVEQTIHQLSRALIRVTRLPPPRRG